MQKTNNGKNLSEVNKLFYNYYKNYESKCCQSVDNCQMPYQMNAYIQAAECPPDSGSQDSPYQPHLDTKFLPSDLFNQTTYDQTYKKLCPGVSNK
jgi:hypothetical protein